MSVRMMPDADAHVIRLLTSVGLMNVPGMTVEQNEPLMQWCNPQGNIVDVCYLWRYQEAFFTEA